MSTHQLTGIIDDADIKRAILWTPRQFSRVNGTTGSEKPVTSLKPRRP